MDSRLDLVNHHHEAAISLLWVIVVDDGLFKEHLALMAACKWLITVEAEAELMSFYHLLSS